MSYISVSTRYYLSPRTFGLIADGSAHPLSERFGSLAAAQAVYPFVTDMTQQIDWAAIQACWNQLVAGGTTKKMVLDFGAAVLGADDGLSTLYFNDDGTSTGNPVIGYTVEGFGAEHTILKYTNLVWGDPTITDGSAGASSYTSRLAHFGVWGGVQLWALQRSSIIDCIRITPYDGCYEVSGRGKGLVVAFCNQLRLDQVRVDNGALNGNSCDGVFIDTSPGIVFIKGSANYNLRGLEFGSLGLAGSTATSAARLYGFYCEGDEQQSLLLDTITSGEMDVTVALTDEWDSGSYAAIDVGTVGNQARNITFGPTCRVNLSTGLSAAGTGINLVNALKCKVSAGCSFQNLSVGVAFGASASLCEVEDSPDFFSSVVTNVTLDASATPNFGTFTPTFSFATPGDSSITYTTQNGSYVLHRTPFGTLVHFGLRIVFITNAFTTASGAARISGLPLTALDADHNFGAITISELSANIGMPAGCTQIVGLVNASANSFSLRGQGASATATLSPTEITASKTYTIVGSGSYWAV